MTPTTAPYFYQSSIVNYLKVDLNNPLHKELYDLFEELSEKFPKTPRWVQPEHTKQATKLMKKIEGFKQSWSLNNTPAWASDLSIRNMSVD
jgi:hypothetical protein